MNSCPTPMLLIDTVFDIYKNISDKFFTVTFQDQSDVYNVNPEDMELVNLLHKSAKENFPVEIIHDIFSFEIIDARRVREVA